MRIVSLVTMLRSLRDCRKLYDDHFGVGVFYQSCVSSCSKIERHVPMKLCAG